MRRTVAKEHESVRICKYIYILQIRYARPENKQLSCCKRKYRFCWGTTAFVVQDGLSTRQWKGGHSKERA